LEDTGGSTCRIGRFQNHIVDGQNPANIGQPLACRKCGNPIEKGKMQQAPEEKRGGNIRDIL